MDPLAKVSPQADRRGVPAGWHIGIMQGRLLPRFGNRIQAFPSRWAEEFDLAAAVGLDCIEWIYEIQNHESNPLGSDAGVREMRALSLDSGVAVRSVCADLLMDEPLLRTPDAIRLERLRRIEWLLDRCAVAGIRRMVLPFVDAAAIDTEADADCAVECIEQLLAAAERANVELHLETALGPGDFDALLDRLPHPLVKINYDSGNSASLGFHPREEFAAYGSRIGSVHVKDRLRGGATVPLGEGDADLPAVFSGLIALEYSGDLILQVARDREADELGWARRNLRSVLDYVAAL